MSVDLFIVQARQAAAGIGGEMAEACELALESGLPEAAVMAMFESRLATVAGVFDQARDALIATVRADFAARRAEVRASRATGGRA